VWLAEVYAAGESPIVAADGRALARALRVAGQDNLLFVEHIQDMASAIIDNAQAGDVVMCMGAGSIGQVAAQVVALTGASIDDKHI
jgi:UDP-N-acetylmuramate--alanine ligase